MFLKNFWSKCVSIFNKRFTYCNNFRKCKSHQKEIEIFSIAERDLEIEQNKSSIKMKTLYNLEMLKKLLTSFSKAKDVGFNSLHYIEKEIVGTILKEKLIVI